MKRDASMWMPLFVADYLADTTHLNTEEHGAYLLLIMAYWRRRGPLPFDFEELAAIAKRPSAEEFRVRLWKRLRQFFAVDDRGFLHHKRIDAEIDRASRNIAKRRAAANARWQCRSPASWSCPRQAGHAAGCDWVLMYSLGDR